MAKLPFTLQTSDLPAETEVIPAKIKKYPRKQSIYPPKLGYGKPATFEFSQIKEETQI
ncbi:hypothetical protein [Fictibacillus sp. KU28468]|uniref:hypothetical protein n=1 Tax=Fictibacillus sp. KU28468 TaxID=2991053 RepID=UPI00223D4871|nr:hypothetical protein [Fictibacillus sp. KU28468]UZJ77692.1 hypothetical protein OKX00_16165 [Fictibacillus sp. KU28468]